jgi:hypothetical protein
VWAARLSATSGNLGLEKGRIVVSRIGKKPIPVPAGVEISIDGNTVQVKGPKGQLSRDIHPEMRMQLIAHGLQHLDHLCRAASRSDLLGRRLTKCMGSHGKRPINLAAP